VVLMCFGFVIENLTDFLENIFRRSMFHSLREATDSRCGPG
jgi:hypothetical protein